MNEFMFGVGKLVIGIVALGLVAFSFSLLKKKYPRISDVLFFVILILSIILLVIR